jgi:hypothetical protein
VAVLGYLSLFLSPSLCVSLARAAAHRARILAGSSPALPTFCSMVCVYQKLQSVINKLTGFFFDLCMLMSSHALGESARHAHADAHDSLRAMGSLSQ